MLRTILLRLSLALALAGTAFPVPESDSAPRPRVQGRTCHFPETSGVWVGYFSGYYEETSVFTLRDVRRRVEVWRCFDAQEKCQSWLYWMRSDFDRGPQLAKCDRK